MYSRGYQRGELFRRVHLPSVERRNQDGNQEESQGIHISSDALSEGPIEAGATSLPRDQSITQSKRKASDVSANENQAAKKTKKPLNNKNKTWTADQVELLLRYVKDFKTKCDFNGIDFEADLASMYTEIRRCMAVDFPDDFGPEVATEAIRPLKEMNGEEYEAFKKQRDSENGAIKKGYYRVKEKIRNVRQDFRTAVNKGTRSGSGKIVQENFELLSEIWGGSPATTSLSFGVDADAIGTDLSTGMSEETLEDTSTAESPSSSSESPTAETPEPSPSQKRKGVALSNIPKLIDNKRRHMEKNLSQAQRDQLFMNTAKEDLLIKKEMMTSFQQSNKTLEDSISKMTMCLTSLGDGIANGMQMLAMALSGQSPNTPLTPRTPQVYHPHASTYGGFTSSPIATYGANSSFTPLNTRSTPSQLNRIGIDEVSQSSPGPGHILGATQALFEEDSFGY